MNPNGPTAADRSAVEAFLYHEAALLDAGALDDWVELFTDDGVYWVPARTDAPDPARHVSIVYDDKPRLLVRVARLQSGKEYAQEPPSPPLPSCCRLGARLQVVAAQMLKLVL